MRYADKNCRCEEVRTDEGHFYMFTGPCVITKKEISVTVPAEELYAYRQGALIQNALTSVNEDDREFLMTGISKEGWDKVFGR